MLWLKYKMNVIIFNNNQKLPILKYQYPNKSCSQKIEYHILL